MAHTPSNIKRWNSIVPNAKLYDYGSRMDRAYGLQTEFVDRSTYNQLKQFCSDLMDQVAEFEGRSISHKD